MYACSPDWKRDWISLTDLEEILNQLAGRIHPSPRGAGGVSVNHGLHFTGGEPFLNFDLLCRAVEIARELGIPSTFVETNCCWCTSEKETRDMLLLLQKKGLGGLLVSVNPFYLEYVPFERTQRAVRVGSAVFGDNLMVYQTEYYRRFIKLGVQGRMAFDDYLRIEKKTHLLQNVEFFMMGRAAYGLKEALGNGLPRYPAISFFRVPCMPPFLRNWHNHFDNYNNFIPGYCGGISFGDTRRLDELLKDGIDQPRFPVLNFLVDGDFKGLFDFSLSHGYREENRGYFSKCHLCVDMRMHLSNNGNFEELRPEEFYRQLV
jgi:hypothetical protein